jgi:hypothetical protein
MTRCCCSWPLLLLPLAQGASRYPTTTAWGAMAEVFSDDLNSQICKSAICSHVLSPPATRRPSARPARDTRAHPHVCARARLRLCDRYTRAPVVACARSCSSLRPPHARTRFFLHAANASMPAASARTLMYLNLWPAPVAPNQGLSWS